MYVVTWGAGYLAAVRDDGSIATLDAPPKEAAALRLALARPIEVRTSVVEDRVITEVLAEYQPGEPGYIEAVLATLGGTVSGP